MRGRVRWLLFVVIVASAVGAVVAWRDAETPEAATPAATVQVTRGRLQQTTLATGVIRPVVGAEVNVGSRISGTVLHLPVKIGDRVEAGQLLAELDAATFEAAVDQAQADVLLAQSRLDQVRSILRRRQQLMQRDLVSAEDLEVAQRDVAVEEAQLRASEARLRSANTVLGYTRIHAPIAGVIADVSTREGETVAASFAAPTFVTIVDLDRLEVLAYVDETDIGRVFVGQQARFRVDAYPGRDFEAQVTAIQPKAQLQGGVVNYIARLDFTAPDEAILRPEMTTHLRLQVGGREETLTIPRRALRRRDGHEFVLVQRQGSWVEQAVRTGWRSQEAVEVLEGLQEGDILQVNS